MPRVDRLYTEFGRLVREMRKDAGLTQSALAKRVGVARTSITNIELGQQHIPLHVLYPIASALGATPEKLLPKSEFAATTTAIGKLDPQLMIELNKQDLAASTKRWIRQVILKTSIVSGANDEAGKIRQKNTRRSRIR